MWAVYISFCICLWQESLALALGDNLSPVGQKASKHQDVAQGTKVKQELTLSLAWELIWAVDFRFFEREEPLVYLSSLRCVHCVESRRMESSSVKMEKGGTVDVGVD